MKTLRFGYEKPPVNSIYLNGMDERQSIYIRFLKRAAEYQKEECYCPFKNLLIKQEIPFENRLVSECVKENKKFIYILEIIYSNTTWLNKYCYQSHSPWPYISEETKSAFKTGLGTMLVTHFQKQSDSPRGDPIKAKVFEKLHLALDRYKIPEKAVIYLTPSPELPSLYKKFCQDRQINHPLKRVDFINYFEKIWGEGYFKQYQKINEIFSYSCFKENHARIRPFKYLCFNREPRKHRKLNLIYLIKNNLLNQGMVSFSNQMLNLLFDKERDLPKDSEFEKLMKEENLLCDLRVDVPFNKSFHISFCKKKPFADTYFSFITERVLDTKSGWSLLTPKIFKTISNMHPFIVLGQKDYLKALRYHNYKTFHPYIDESYDGISDPVLRVKAVWKEVKKLCALSLSELHNWCYSLTPILEHNWNVFHRRRISSEYDDFIKKLTYRL